MDSGKLQRLMGLIAAANTELSELEITLKVSADVSGRDILFVATPENSLIAGLRQEDDGTVQMVVYNPPHKSGPVFVTKPPQKFDMGILRGPQRENFIETALLVAVAQGWVLSAGSSPNLPSGDLSECGGLVTPGLVAEIID